MCLLVTGTLSFSLEEYMNKHDLFNVNCYIKYKSRWTELITNRLLHLQGIDCLREWTDCSLGCG